MEYIKVADQSEIPVNQMKMVKAKGMEILLANLDGTFYAIANRCTHLGGSLAQGTLNKGIVTCPRHHAQFDVKTGQAVDEAKIAFLKMKVKDEETFPVKVEGTSILLGME